MGFQLGARRLMGRTARGRHAPPTAANRRHFSGKGACRQQTPEAVGPVFSLAFTRSRMMPRSNSATAMRTPS